jgi:hypothetical protein
MAELGMNERVMSLETWTFALCALRFLPEVQCTWNVAMAGSAWSLPRLGTPT